jgi:hypothetical protein
MFSNNPAMLAFYVSFSSHFVWIIIRAYSIKICYFIFNFVWAISLSDLETSLVDDDCDDDLIFNNIIIICP